MTPRTLGIAENATRKHTMAPLTVEPASARGTHLSPVAEIAGVHDRAWPCATCRARVARGHLALPTHPACAAYLGAR